MNATAARPADNPAGKKAFRPWRARANLSAWTLSAPAVLFIAVLFVYPLLDVVIISFTDPTLSLVNYREFFSSSLYSRVLGNTFLVRLRGDRDLPVAGLSPRLRHRPLRRHPGVRAVAGGGHELLDELSRPHLLVAGDPGQQGSRDQAAGLGRLRPGAADPVQQLRHHPGHGAHPDPLHDPVHLRGHAEDRPQPPAGGREPGRHPLPGLSHGLSSVEPARRGERLHAGLHHLPGILCDAGAARRDPGTR